MTTKGSTVKIAKSYGVKCFEFDWHEQGPKEYILIKNYTINGCFVWLTDEALSEELTVSISEVLKEVKRVNEFDGFVIISWV